MADQYPNVTGFVQFDPGMKTLDDGTELFEFLIKTPGLEGTKIRVSVWPELYEVMENNKPQQGDFVAVEGKYSEGKGNDGTVYHNLTAYRILVGRTDQTERKAAGSGPGTVKPRKKASTF